MSPATCFPHHREMAPRAGVPTMRPGERLPPDTDLCRELGVSG
jgi:hypothetical protein